MVILYAHKGKIDYWQKSLPTADTLGDVSGDFSSTYHAWTLLGSPSF